MNFKLHNQDLRILEAEAGTPRFNQTPGWLAVDWKPTPSGGNMIFLRQLALPPNCSAERTDVKIEAPANLYEPTWGSRLMFYRNIWISPNLRLYDPRRRRQVKVPRLSGRDGDGFAFLCLHPDAVEPGTNILDFIRVLDLFLVNPGYKAAAWEAA